MFRMTDTFALLLGVALIAFVWVAARSARGGMPWSSSRWSWSRSSAEAELIALCRRDLSRAERLIDLELRRAPELSRAQAARRALERYRHDNR